MWVWGRRYASIAESTYTVDYDLYVQEALMESGIQSVCQDAVNDDIASTGVLNCLIRASLPVKRQLFSCFVGPFGRSWSRAWALELMRRRLEPTLRFLVDGIEQVLQRRQSILDDFPALIKRASKIRLPNQPEPTGPEIRGERQLGQWDHLVRVLAGHDPSQLDRVLAWPLRDALVAFEYQMMLVAREDYKHSMLVYTNVAPYAKKGSGIKPPRVPRLLRGRHG